MRKWHVLIGRRRMRNIFPRVTKEKNKTSVPDDQQTKADAALVQSRLGNAAPDPTGLLS